MSVPNPPAVSVSVPVRIPSPDAPQTGSAGAPRTTPSTRPSAPEDNDGKPLTMRMYSVVPQDQKKRYPRHCVPRVAQIQIARVVLLRPLKSSYHHVHFTVGIQGSRRTMLRAKQIPLPNRSEELMDTAVDLFFSLYYIHNLKDPDNVLRLSLRKRRRGRNKLIAVAYLSLDDLLQMSYEGPLELVGPAKNDEEPVARITVSVVTLPASSVPAMTADFDEYEEIDVLEEIRDAGTGGRQARGGQESDDGGTSSDPDLFSDDVDALDPAVPEAEEMLDEGDEDEEEGEVVLSKRTGGAASRVMRRFIKARPPKGRGKLREKLSKFISKSRGTREGQEDDEEGGDAVGASEEIEDAAPSSPATRMLQSGTEDRGMDELGSLPPKDSGLEPSDTSDFEGNHIQDNRPSNGASDGGAPDDTVAAPQPMGDRDLSRTGSGVFLVPPSHEDPLDSDRGRPTKELAASTMLDASVRHALCLVEAQCRRGLVLMRHSQVVAGDRPWSLRGRCTVVQSMQDIQNAITAGWKAHCGGQSKPPPQHAPLHVAVAYSHDAFVHEILRVFADPAFQRRFVASRTPLDCPFVFCLLPLRGERSLLAQIIAAHDPRYRALFFDGRWKESFERGRKVTEGSSEVVDDRVSTFVATAKGVLNLDIGEALISYKRGEEEEMKQVTLPFVRTIDIDVVDEREGDLGDVASTVTPVGAAGDVVAGEKDTGEKEGEEKETPEEKDREKAVEKEKDKLKEKQLNLDYWEPGRDKLRKVSIRAQFHMLSLHMKQQQYSFAGSTPEKERDKEDKEEREKEKDKEKSRERSREKDREGKEREQEVDADVFELQALYTDRPSKAKALTRKLGLGGGSDGADSLRGTPTKVVCSSPGERGFRVNIDGAEWRGVQLISVSRQWHGPIKAMPVSVFRGHPSGEKAGCEVDGGEENV